MNPAIELSHPVDLQDLEDAIPVFARRFGSWQILLRRRPLDAGALAASYDREAAGWSRKLDRFGFPSAYETLLRRVLREEPWRDAGTPLRVLDGGVGTGALSCALARALPVPFELDAIDISPRMLEHAGRSLRDIGVDVSLRHGDVCDLPYGTSEFDLVLTGHVLEHLVDPRVALSEMTRVLKPGGLLIACLTRRSALGMYVQLKWRTHRVRPVQAERWLLESGLEKARCLSFDRRAFSRRLSVACLGRKPLTE